MNYKSFASFTLTTEIHSFYSLLVGKENYSVGAHMLKKMSCQKEKMK